MDVEFAEMTPLVLTERQARNFANKINRDPRPTGCWEWTAGKVEGYGRLKIGGTLYLAHRVAYALAHGREVPPPSLQVCHTCDNPPCCNPAHLWLGTLADNAADRSAKGRSARLCGDANPARQHPERMPRGLKNGAYTKPASRPRGERSGAAKLTDSDVLEIRRLYAEKALNQVQLGVRYSVSQVLISKVVRRDIWTHIP